MAMAINGGKHGAESSCNRQIRWLTARLGGLALQEVGLGVVQVDLKLLLHLQRFKRQIEEKLGFDCRVKGAQERSGRSQAPPPPVKKYHAKMRQLWVSAALRVV